jgi:hypothetical protein
MEPVPGDLADSICNYGQLDLSEKVGFAVPTASLSE